MSLYERTCDENADKYKNWKGDVKNEDWTLTKIANTIRKSPVFFELPKRKQKEYSADEIVNFFRKNTFYKSYVYENSNKHTVLMRDWRLKPVEEDEDDEE